MWFNKWSIIVGLLSLSLAAASCGKKFGEGAPLPVGDSSQAAANALDTLRALVTEQNYKNLGFDSVSEVKNAALGAPLPVYEIGLDRLKGYEAGQDGNALLTPTEEILYPVAVGGETRSSVSVVKKERGYVPSSFGKASIAKGLARFRGQDTAATFAVHIPILGLYFLGRRIEGRLMVTPVVESTRPPLRAGAIVPIEEIVKAIGPLLRAYNGLPL